MRSSAPPTTHFGHATLVLRTFGFAVECEQVIWLTLDVCNRSRAGGRGRNPCLESARRRSADHRDGVRGSQLRRTARRCNHVDLFAHAVQGDSRVVIGSGDARGTRFPGAVCLKVDDLITRDLRPPKIHAHCVVRCRIRSDRRKAANYANSSRLYSRNLSCVVYELSSMRFEGRDVRVRNSGRSLTETAGDQAAQGVPGEAVTGRAYVY